VTYGEKTTNPRTVAPTGGAGRLGVQKEDLTHERKELTSSKGTRLTLVETLRNREIPVEFRLDQKPLTSRPGQLRGLVTTKGESGANPAFPKKETADRARKREIQKHK